MAFQELDASHFTTIMYFLKVDVYIIGRRCCLWCEIKQDQLIIPRASRGRLALRILETLTANHNAFLQDGGDLKTAKFFKKVIGA